jgi:REP element-mobilizing transposase RayT
MWNDTDTPLAYFISFRTYGTWLHGDLRGSIDRFHNRYESPYLPPNNNWHRHNQELMKSKQVILGAKQRASVETAIREACRIRLWSLQAVNVRTNHVHTVVTANRIPKLVLNAFKANATRHLRAAGLWPHAFSPWADKGSNRRLWNERSVARAIDYVLHGQGGSPPDFDD